MRTYAFLAVFGTMLPMALVQPFVGALLWCWIAFMNPHREVWGFGTGLPYAVIVFGTTALAWLVSSEPKRFAANWVTVLLIVLAVLVTMTSFSSLAPAAATWSKWDRTVKTIAGALLVACMLTSRERIHALVWLMAIAIGFYGVKGGIFTINTGGGFIVLGPPDSMISDRNHLAVAILVAVPLLNYLRMHSAHRLVRLGLLAAMVLMVVSAVGSQSRGALVALAATAVMLWLRSRGKLMSGIVIVACVAATLNFMPQSWVDRMNTIQNFEEDESAMGRVRIWQVSWLLALDRPLTGSGFRGPYQPDVVAAVDPAVAPRAVHSIYFEVLGEHGFPAFVVWLGLTVAGAFYAWRLVRLARDRPDLAWAGDLGRMAQVSMVAYLTGGAFLSLSYWDYYWTLLIVIAATYKLAVTAAAPERRAAVAQGWQRPPSGAAALSGAR